MDDKLVEEFERGVDDYWSGILPEGWDAPDAMRNPYLAGWNLAADFEHQQNFFATPDEVEDGFDADDVERVL